MAFAIKTDGWAGSGTNVSSMAAQDVMLWCTAAVTEGDWIATHATDTTNPGAIDGESYRTADADNADAKYGTVGVALQTTSAAGYAMVRIAGSITSANVADAVSDGNDLSIGTTAGRAIAYTGTDPDLRVIGRATSDGSVSNVASVIIYRHPRFTV